MSIPPPAPFTLWWARLVGFAAHCTTQAQLDALRPYQPTKYQDPITGQIVDNGTIPVGPVIIGMSPTEVAAVTGMRLDVIPAGDPNNVFYNVPNITVYPQGELIDPSIGPAPLDVGFGPLPGTGKFWAWNCSIEGYGGVTPVTTPVFQLKVGTYTGNGTAQAIAVGFDLTVAHASVLVKPLSGGGSARSAWRVTGLNGSATIGNNTLDTLAITGLTNTGFTVGNSAHANANAVKYGYVAMTDTTGTYMRVGTYTGVGNTGISITAVNTGDTTVTCNNAQTSWIGAIADFTTQQYVITGVVPNVSLTLGAGWQGALGTPVLGTVLGDNRLINFGGGLTPTDAWVMGGSQIYRSPSMVANQSVSLGANGSASPMINGIKALLPGTFRIGTNSDVNQNNFVYAYVVLNAVPAAMQALFKSGSRNPATGSDTIVGIPFQPGWVTTIDAAAAQNGVWRDINGQVGTDSTSWAGNPDGVLDVPAQGISSLDAAGFHTGSTAMPAGHEVYWFAFKGAGSISATPNGSIAGVCSTAVGVVGLPFHTSLSATGGTAPYLYLLYTGSLPPGLVLAPDGTIEGTPTQAGAFTYTAEISDATQSPLLTTTVTCTITITASEQPLPPDPVPPTGPVQVCSSTVPPPSDAGSQGCRILT